MSEYANLPLSPIGIPAEARAARPDTRALHIGPPPGVSDDDCATVEALVGNFSGAQAYADYWRPDPEALAVLNAGGFIELVQWAPRMVMHSVSVWPAENPQPSTLEQLEKWLRAATEAEWAEPCRLDHNDDCQGHGHFDGPCPIPAIKAYFEAGE